MIKLSSYSMFVIEVPRYLLFYIPLFWVADKILVLDNSMLELKDCRPEIDRLLKFLKILKLDNKTTILDPIKYDKEMWRANERSVEEIKDLIQPLRYKRDESFYWAGYLGHRLLLQYSKYYYVENIIQKKEYAKKELLFVGRKKVGDSSGGWLKQIFTKINYISFGIFIIIGMPPLLFMLMLKNIKFVKKQPIFWKGGLCIDLLHGPVITSKSEINPDVHGDTYFVEKDGLFSMENTSFMAFGWKNKDNQTWKNILEAKKSTVFGDQIGPIKIRMVDFIKLYLENYRLVLNYFVENDISIKKKVLNYDWFYIKYFVYRLRVQINFYHNRPSVYFSRLDYSYLQHPLGAVCNRYGIHYAGVCHSPLGGVGYNTLASLLSYDTYFIYTSVFSEDYFNSWKNDHTHLVPVGVWRSDFSVAIKDNAEYLTKRKEIREKYCGKFIVGLHLPVPNTGVFRRQEVDYWLGGFEKMINELSDVVFILFPRRHVDSPQYFQDWVRKIKNLDNCEVAHELNSDWSTSYPWTYVCDMVVGCSYSDVVLEALACGTPAVSYADFGKDLSQLQRFDKNLAVYSIKSLTEMIVLTQSAKWPTTEDWAKYAKEFVGIADGRSRKRMKNELETHILPKSLLNVQSE
jgi:hypothetical protein